MRRRQPHRRLEVVGLDRQRGGIRALCLRLAVLLGLGIGIARGLGLGLGLGLGVRVRARARAWLGALL